MHPDEAFVERSQRPGMLVGRASEGKASLDLDRNSHRWCCRSPIGGNYGRRGRRQKGARAAGDRVLRMRRPSGAGENVTVPSNLLVQTPAFAATFAGTASTGHGATCRSRCVTLPSSMPATRP